MFKRLFGAVFTILEVIGFSAVVSYGMECGKDVYKKHKEEQTKKAKKSKGHN